MSHPVSLCLVQRGIIENGKLVEMWQQCPRIDRGHKKVRPSKIGAFCSEAAGESVSESCAKESVQIRLQETWVKFL